MTSYLEVFGPKRKCVQLVGGNRVRFSVQPEGVSTEGVHQAERLREENIPSMLIESCVICCVFDVKVTLIKKQEVCTSDAS